MIAEPEQEKKDRLIQEWAQDIENTLEGRIDALALKAYELKNRKFTPLYPWVFVRVLPKEQIQNGIILPAIEQNKTIHEGIILATWQKTPRVAHECELKVGDHGAFPHWAGIPVAGFSAKHYRVIRSEDWVENQQGGIFATVEYDNIKPTEKLRKYLAFLRKRADDYPSLEDEAFIEMAVQEIERQFLLVDREATSVTLSGR